MIAKCIDSDGNLSPCISAGVPDKLRILSSNDMIGLSYIKCDIFKVHYLSNADRDCDCYRGSNPIVPTKVK